MQSSWFDLLLDIVLAPALWLSIALALVYGWLFYGWRGGGWRQLGRDLVAGLAGFGLGQLTGMLFGISWLVVGQVQLLWGTLGAVLGLALGRRFWPRPRGKSGARQACRR